MKELARTDQRVAVLVSVEIVIYYIEDLVREDEDGRAVCRRRSCTFGLGLGGYLIFGARIQIAVRRMFGVTEASDKSRTYPFCLDSIAVRFDTAVAVKSGCSLEVEVVVT